MKLRNKKTGEIGYLIVGKGNDHYVVTNDEWEDCGKYNSLTELTEDWEDYEEPKEHWCITMYGGITRIKDNEEPVDDLKEIGNYFESKEDAYDALDELKAWKRLKDRGFRFKTIHRNPQGTYNIYANFEGHIPPSSNDISSDLNICFGGEE